MSHAIAGKAPGRAGAPVVRAGERDHTISRRRLLQILAAGSAVGGGLSLAACVPEEPPVTGQHALSDTGPPLRALAAERGLTIGTAILAFQLWELEYARLIERHFSQITEEGAGFMTEIQPTQGEWTFDRLDTTVQFAEVRDQTLRIQALVWGHETATSEDFFHGWTPTPEWVRKGDWSRDELLAIMREHIATVMRRYKGRVREYMVVNEPLHSDSRYEVLQPNVWHEGIGPEYIRLAFEHARHVDPDARLILNEWGADYARQEIGPPGRAQGYNRSQCYHDLVTELLEQGTPIDGVGFQFHLEVGVHKPTVSTILDNFARYHALGLSTHITELDVRIRKPITQTKLEEQARLYRTAIQAAIESPSTRDVMLLGFTDRYSWITAGAHHDGSLFPDHLVATLMDNEYHYYPSFHAVREALSAPAG